jgi:cysteine desulfurase
MNREIFLDNNATTQPLPEVTAAVVGAMSESFGNASSNNRAGERARRLLRESRESIAYLIGAVADSISFTSGATEANNWVLQRVCGTPGKSLVTTVAEHSSITSLCDYLEVSGIRVERLPINLCGRVDVERLAEAVGHDTTLVSVHWVNNETGVIQPVEEIAAICRERGILFHTDASQAVGKLQIDVKKLGCDFLSFSGHKFHGPQGIGGLYIRPGVKLRSLLFGGDQEHARRAGTENLPGIAGLGAAAAERFSKMDTTIVRLRQLRDRFESAVTSRLPNVVINGDVEDRVCNTTNLRFEGVNGEALVARLDQQGVRCSQSSACTNQRPEPSYVLRAMGLSESQAYASIRFSVSVGNSNEEIDESIEILAKLVPDLVRFASQNAVNS